VWNQNTPSNIFKKSKVEVEFNPKYVTLPRREEELAAKLQKVKKMEKRENFSRWKEHYTYDLIFLYNILLDECFQLKLHSFSFTEFVMYIYKNTERYYDIKRGKKARLLL
jgi:hypothetical protein